jgi:GLPGLI family protein
MKALLLTPFLLAASLVQAQQTSGTIQYEQNVKLDIELDGNNVPEGLAAMLPKNQKFQKVLYFTPAAVLFENATGKKNEASNDYMDNGVAVKIERHMPDDKIYTDLNGKTITEQKDFMGRMFLISRPAGVPKWKMTGRQKKLLDLPCMEATAVKGEDTLVAWYTTAIPVNAGPEGIGGLPGAIMELSVGPLVTYKAVSFTPGDVASRIKVPTKGKKMTETEFKKMVDAKEEELLKQFGGSGDGKTRIIINAQ